jgi:hypothetical protein
MENLINSQEISYAQPYESRVEIVEKTNAKGDITPEITISISRKYNNEETILTTLSSDIAAAVDQAKGALKRLKEMN